MMLHRAFVKCMDNVRLLGSSLQRRLLTLVRPRYRPLTLLEASRLLRTPDTVNRAEVMEIFGRCSRMLCELETPEERLERVRAEHAMQDEETAHLVKEIIRHG